MNRLSSLLVLVTGLALLTTIAACGGGVSGNDDNGHTSTRLTDPAAVPSSTQTSGDLRYLIRDNGVSAPSGMTTAVPDGGGSGGSSSSTYTVEPDDTCGAIASRLGIDLAELLKVNPLVDSGCTNLRPGQTLKVPGSAGSNNGSSSNEPTATPRPSSGLEYVVKEGDLCVDIAGSYGVDVDEMIALNNLDCGNLQIGQVIKIP